MHRLFHRSKFRLSSTFSSGCHRFWNPMTAGARNVSPPHILLVHSMDHSGLLSLGHLTDVAAGVLAACPVIAWPPVIIHHPTSCSIMSGSFLLLGTGRLRLPPAPNGFCITVYAGRLCMHQLQAYMIPDHLLLPLRLSL